MGYGLGSADSEELTCYKKIKEDIENKRNLGTPMENL